MAGAAARARSRGVGGGNSQQPRKDHCMHRKLIFVLGLSLALASAGGCSYLHRGTAAAAAPGPLRLLKLDNSVLNLADQGAYLRLGVSVGLHATAVEDAPEGGDDGVETVTRDTIVTLAGAQTSAALLAPDGKDTLKRAIVTELQKRLPLAQISTVYFDDFLVQTP